MVAWAWSAANGPFTWGDDADYRQQAENLVASRGWSSGTPAETEADPRLVSRRLPGYGLVLAAVRAVSPSQVWVGAVQSVLALGLAWGVFRVAARVGPVRWGPLAIGLVLTPSFWITAQVELSDLLFAALLFLAAERVVAFAERGRGRELAWANGLLGAAFLVKPVLLYFWPLALALTGWMLWRREARGLSLWPAAVAGLVPVLAVGLAIAHGAPTGHREVTSLQTQNLWQQNARRAMLRTGDESVYEATDARLAAIPDYTERQRATSDAAREAILARPLAYATVHLQGVATFVLDPGRHDLAIFFGLPVGTSGGMDAASRGSGSLARFLAGQSWPMVLVLVALTLWNVAVAVAFVAWVWRSDASVELRIWAFVLVAYLAFITGPVGSARYRLAVLPVVVLALPWVWEQVARRTRPASVTA